MEVLEAIIRELTLGELELASERNDGYVLRRTGLVTAS